jgi:hypothetical protein
LIAFSKEIDAVWDLLAADPEAPGYEEERAQAEALCMKPRRGPQALRWERDGNLIELPPEVEDAYRRGLTTKQVAAMIGVSAYTVWRWRTGRDKPSAESLEKVKEAFAAHPIAALQDPTT